MGPKQQYTQPSQVWVVTCKNITKIHVNK